MGVTGIPRMERSGGRGGGMRRRECNRGEREGSRQKGEKKKDGDVYF